MRGIIAGLVLLTAACSGSVAGSSGDGGGSGGNGGTAVGGQAGVDASVGGTGGSICAPGQQVSCACLYGAVGIQVCKQDGSGFEPCACPDGGTGGVGGTGGTGMGICLLNNCNADVDCAACSQGRTKCDLAEHRCVACSPAAGINCPAGQVCSSFGLCVSSGAICPVDPQGQPTVTCATNSDCAACDPLHQICDTIKSKCVACTPTNMSACLPTEVCTANQCVKKCPDSCTTDTGCASCEVSSTTKAKSCSSHVCSECSDTYSCAGGLVCQKGSCVKACGLPSLSPGTCVTDGDCASCGAAGSPSWKCKYPINGGLHGSCAPPLSGCSDLGQTSVLPPPYDQAKSLCSTTADCAGVSVQYNVGQQVRNILGSSEIDIGIKKISIQDANVARGVNVCASLELVNNVKCGVCVPCKLDSDCKPIKMDMVVFDLFKGDPLAQIAGAFLIDKLWGKDAPALHFKCQAVAPGFGSCAPCANPTKPCGVVDGPGTGQCSHDVCTVGGPLKADCGSCAAEVCKTDSYCCTKGWDAMCIAAVPKHCPTGCGGTVPTTTCDHTPCTTGKPLNKSCSSCVNAICTKDPYCCSTSWDATCVTHAQSESSCATACGSQCAHSPCATGGPLAKSCSACVTSVCNSDPYCCATDWDSQCVSVSKAVSACGC